MSAEKNLFNIKTNPTKLVVVESLTRDIDPYSAIFELIDNSIDAAHGIVTNDSKNVLKNNLPKSYKGVEISLSISGEKIIIQDNCTGISIEKFKSIALRFGKDTAHENGIGAFGVGLNRALFKLGRYFSIQTDTGSEASILDLDVDQYIEDEEWDIQGTVTQTTNQSFTKIDITKLPDEISGEFGDPDNITNLAKQIGLRYGRLIAKDLTIKLNDEETEDKLPKIRKDSKFKEKSLSYTDDNIEIQLTYGQHDLHRFAKEPGSSKNNGKYTDEYGWTILCNDRAILISELTEKTGWDVQKHSEHYGLAGVIEFSSKSPSKLPWNTLKNDVDLNTLVYQGALKKLRVCSAKWRSFVIKAKKQDFWSGDQSASASVSAAQGGADGQDTPTVQGGASSQGIPAGQVDVNTHAGSNKTNSSSADKEDHNQSTKILPSDINVQHCRDKLLALVNEAKGLDLEVFPYAGMGLLRNLFTLAGLVYFTRKGRLQIVKNFSITQRNKKRTTPLTEKEEKKVTPSTDEIVAYIEQHPESLGSDMGPFLQQSVKQFAKFKKILNGTVHQPFQTVSKFEAISIKDTVLPIFRHFIED